MQRGIAGAAIVTMVLAATILVGYIIADPTTYEVTRYDSLSDLAPIVSADPASEYVEYYPAGNVTGWTGAVSLPLTNTATTYVYTPASSSYTSTEYSNMAGAKGVWIPSQSPIGLGSGTSFNTQRTGVTTNYFVDPAGYYFMGGASGNVFRAFNTYGWTTYNMSLNGTAANGVYWIDLSQVSAGFTQDMAISAPDLSLYSNCTVSSKTQSVSIPGQPTSQKNYYTAYTISGNLVSYSTPYIYYQKSTDAWYPATYDATYGFKISGSSLGSDLRFIATDNPQHSWSLIKPEVLPTQYVLPNTSVTVSGTATWSNGLTNGVVQILHAATVKVTPADLSSGPYSMILTTIDALNGRTYWQGVMDYVNPTQYTVVDYIHETSYVYDVEDLAAIQLTGNGAAYIVRTVVAMDPNGVLWSNPTMNLGYYFPEALANGARVLFNGFVVTGDSMTIDGHTYSVSGSEILINGALHKLAGMAVDYRIDGHTYVVFTQESKAEYDLGSSSTKSISATGTWYYTSELQSIKTQIKESNGLAFGAWNMDETTTCLVFVGFLIIGAVAGAHLIPGGLRPLDWIVLIAAGAIALCIM